MQLLDTHQHLILRGRLGYRWTDEVPALATGDFAHADYRALTDGAGIAATIFMETGVDDADHQAEARLVAGLVGQGPGPVIQGQIASCRPEIDAGFTDWLEECRGLHVVGFRRILHEVDDGVSQTETYRRNTRAIGAAGWPVDLCFLARQLGIAEDLIRACPDMRFVLDHCGVPDIAGGGFAPWAASMARLSRLPNLWVKLSGITRYGAAGRQGKDEMQPWVDQVLQLFGPGRMVWGSDWPVVNLGAGLPGWVAMTRAFLAGLSEDEQAAIGHRNAKALYLTP